MNKNEYFGQTMLIKDRGRINVREQMFVRIKISSSFRYIWYIFPDPEFFLPKPKNLLNNSAPQNKTNPVLLMNR